MRLHKSPVALAALALLYGLGCSLPATAQSTKQRLTSVEERLDRLERIVDNNDSETDMLRQIRELQDENQTLRNEIEVLQFETARSGDRQRELYVDLDDRMQAIEAGGALAVIAGATGGAATGSTQVSGSDRKDYQAAFDLLKQARYEEAAAGFTAFLAAYSDSELRDNAQYWLAETSYVTQDFSGALAGFQKVISDYPTSRKISDAWLKVGYCNYELEKWADARQALSIVQSRYPETTAARLAEQRLQLMKSEGH